MIELTAAQQAQVRNHGGCSLADREEWEGRDGTSKAYLGYEPRGTHPFVVAVFSAKAARGWQAEGILGRDSKRSTRFATRERADTYMANLA